MEPARRRAACWLAVSLLATAGVAAAAPPAQAQLRDAPDADFLIGAAVTPNLLGNPTYANIAGTEFSSLTAENHMKWDTLQPSQGNFNFGPGDQVVAFAQQNNQHVYGHTLVWHSQTPQWVQNLSGSALSQAMQSHITTVMQHYAGEVSRWDVVNEAVSDSGGQLRNSFWLQGLGSGYIAQALQAARAADPDATLCLNDYSIDGINTKSTAYFNLVQQLQAQGVPIDCMSFQAHLILGQVPSSMQQNLQRFANLGLEVWITELDIRIPEPVSQQELQQQAQEFAQVFQICQSVPACAGVTTWGIHDAQSWVDSTFPEFDAPLMWDDNLNPKPAYQAVLDQLGGEPGGEEPPAAPTGLAVTGTTTSSVSLSWNASTGATSYQIQRAPGTSGGSFTQVGTTAATSFTNPGLSPASTFRYRVTASNPAGTSAPSNTVTATTQPGAGGGGGCQITYQAANWGGHPGFTATVTVTNTSSTTITAWTAGFTYTAGQDVEEPGWNATVSQNGPTVTAVNATWNGTLAPAQSTSFGFNALATAIGNNPNPTGLTCTTG
jgi:endo-1,4-beta-xylanase